MFGRVFSSTEEVKEVSSPVWKTLQRVLPSRDAALDYWWSLTGQHLATLLQAAGYDDSKTYESLLFLHQWIVSL